MIQIEFHPYSLNLGLKFHACPSCSYLVISLLFFTINIPIYEPKLEPVNPGELIITVPGKIPNEQQRIIIQRISQDLNIEEDQVHTLMIELGMMFTTISYDQQSFKNKFRFLESKNDIYKQQELIRGQYFKYYQKAHNQNHE